MTLVIAPSLPSHTTGTEEDSKAAFDYSPFTLHPVLILHPTRYSRSHLLTRNLRLFLSSIGFLGQQPISTLCQLSPHRRCQNIIIDMPTKTKFFVSDLSNPTHVICT